MFIPVGGAQQPAAGRTDAEGTYTLTTFQPDDGALPGEYRVTVTKQEVPTEFAEEAEAAPAGEDEEELAAPKSLLPEEYADVEQSPLTATVAEAENTVDLELE